jgi:RHS repeat-associated protein
VISQKQGWSVSQSANGAYAQPRSYSYDGVGRLIQEKNPESGTVNYTYDSITSGNCQGSYPGDLLMKVDNILNVTCGQYDGLHRVTSYTYPAGPYSGVTPPKTFVYDTTSETCSDPSGSNILGRLADAYTGTSSAKKVDTQYCYSPRGQTTDVFQSTPSSGGYAHLELTYWANGPITTINGITGLSNMRYGLDGEGRVNGFDPTALTPDPVKTVSYNAASQITNVNFNSGETDAYSYDVMGRMNNYTYALGTSSLVGTPAWNPNGTLETLNITDEFNSLNTQNCTYTYDDLARIGNVGCSGGVGWGQTFTYDPFGNITKTGSSSWIPGYYNSNGSTNNQYVGGGTSYDGNGNLTNDTFNTYTWDSDGNIATVKGTTNTYDAFDKVVETSAGPTQFLYLPGGAQPFASMSNYKTYLKAFAPAPGGSMILTPNGKEGVLAYHRHADWIGSSRFATTPAETVYFDGAYAPFGEPYATTGTTDYVFAGNAQDASVVEGGTAGYAYDTVNRKYSGSQSRWISPDPAGLGAVDPSNPQTWNRYPYIANSPLSSTDPTGMSGSISYSVCPVPANQNQAICQGGYEMSMGGGMWFTYGFDEFDAWQNGFLGLVLSGQCCGINGPFTPPQEILTGEDCVSCYPLGPDPMQIAQAILSGNYWGAFLGSGIIPQDPNCEFGACGESFPGAMNATPTLPPSGNPSNCLSQADAASAPYYANAAKMPSSGNVTGGAALGVLIALVTKNAKALWLTPMTVFRENIGNLLNGAFVQTGVFNACMGIVPMT